MNIDTKQGARRLCVATFAVWLSTWFEIVIREHFHQQHAHLDNMAWLAMAPLLVVGEWVLKRLYRGPGVSLAGRWPHYFVVATSMWIWVVMYGGAAGNRFKTAVVAAIGVYCLSWLLLRLSARLRGLLTSSRWPTAVAAGIWLFVVSPAVIATFQSERLAWPDRRPEANSAKSNGAAAKRPNTVVLLFDELDFSASGLIRQALVDAGLSVSARPVNPVGDRTAKVIPAMWLHRPFEEARACGWTAICSGSQVLDFANVDVVWPDVDVVGFYFPYCAMRGLRSCHRESPSPAIEDEQRFSCAVRRRLGFSILNACVSNQHDAWTTLVKRVERSYWDAPIWKEGGMIYAHLPIPHPPGADAKASLVDHYTTGVGKAVLLVKETVKRLQALAGEPFDVVVVSDHPLRVDMWCSNGTYAKARCRNVDGLRDQAVPLIVGSSGVAPRLDAYVGNEQLFELVTQLRNGTVRQP